jgi:hypothetical protein
MIQRWSLAALAACSVAFSLDAATLVVDASGGGDFATIQQAIDAAADGDRILVRPGTYTAISLNSKDLVIESTQGAASTTISAWGQPNSAVTFGTNSPLSATLRGFKVVAGAGNPYPWGVWRCGGGAFIYQGSGTIEDCDFLPGAGGTGYGGGIWAFDGSFVIRRCSFVSLSVQHHGGGISLGPYSSTVPVPAYPEGTRAVIEECRFENCYSWNVGGLGLILSERYEAPANNFAGRIVVRRCEFSGNAASVNAPDMVADGILKSSTASNVDVSDCVFWSGGNRLQSGGYWSFGSAWNVNVNRCVFVGADSQVSRVGGLLSVADSWFCDGSVSVGGEWIDDGGNEAGCPQQSDCNGDGSDDFIQVLLGKLADTNANGIPDACETFHVPSQYPTIQDAVDAAPSGAIVLVAPGTYAPFDFRSKQIVVRSAAGAATTIIDAAGLPTSAVVFGAGSPMQATLRGFTIRPGAGSFINPASPSYRGGGGCFLLDGSGQIEDCVFVGGASGCGYGGGVWSTNGSIAVRRCSFDSIGVEHYGGAIAVHPRFSSVTVSGEPEGTRVLIEDCTIRNCSSFNVGGIDIRLYTDWTVGNMSGRVVVRRCEFSGNSSSVHGRDILAAGFGGADPAALARLEDCVFGSSGTVVQMGYYDAAGGGTMEVDGCVIGSQNAQIGQTAGALSIANSWFCDGSVSVNGAWTDLGGNSATCPPAYDCDGNGIDDFYDIILGRLPDTDGDFITDGCEPISVPGDFPTIQAAIDSVAVGVREVIEVAAGTYNESFALNGKDIVVRGAPNNATILDGAGLSSSIARFTGNEPATAGVENLVFRNGTAGSLLYQGAAFDVGGAIYGLNSAAFIRNCRFEHCASDYGGAVYLLYCRMNVSGCTFDSNTAFDEGGGLFVYETTGPVLNCSFTSNDTSVNGPGAGSAFKAVGARATGEVVELTGCTFAGNRGLLTASAIEYYENVQSNPGVLRISGCSVTGNQSGTTIPSGAAGLRVLGRNTSCIITGGTTVCSNSPKNIEGPFLIEGAATLCECFADVTGDGLVNGGDLGVLLSAWGIALPSGAGDVNHDGMVDATDLSMVLGSWGSCP